MLHRLWTEEIASAAWAVSGGRDVVECRKRGKQKNATDETVCWHGALPERGYCLHRL